METLGKRIARLRKAKNLSQTELATACGWENGQARVGNYELDKREPTLSNLRTIADALGTTLMHLVEGDPDQDATPPAHRAVSIVDLGHGEFTTMFTLRINRGNTHRCVQNSVH